MNPNSNPTLVFFAKINLFVLFGLVQFHPIVFYGQQQTYYLEKVYSATGIQTQESFERTVSAIDGSLNVYLAGSQLNQYNKYDLVLSKFNGYGNLQWSEAYNLPDTLGNVIVGEIAIGQSGNVFVTGTAFNGILNDYDLFVVKYTPGGAKIWDNTYNGNASLHDGGTGLIVDDDDNVYVIGGTTDTVDMADILVSKYDSLGNNQWTTTMDGYGYFDIAGFAGFYGGYSGIRIAAAIQQDPSTWAIGQFGLYTSDGSVSIPIIINSQSTLHGVKDVTFDLNDNIYVTGYRITTPGNQRDIVTIKLNNNLQVIWEEQFDGGYYFDEEPNAITVDEDGNVFLTGFSVSSGGKDILYLKYSSAGNLDWAQKVNGHASGNDEGVDIEADSQFVYLAGYITNNSSKDYYTAIADKEDGSITWSGIYNGIFNKDDYGRDVFLDKSGNIMIVGASGTNNEETSYVIVKYRKSELQLVYNPDTTSHAVFIENIGQLVMTNDSLASSVGFYSYSSDQITFYQDAGVSMVLAKIDTSTVVSDSLFRVDINFGKGDPLSKPFGLKQKDIKYNYYLSHIPNGRERVRTFEQIVYPCAFENIDVQVLNTIGNPNFSFLCKPGSDPSEIELAFEGADSIFISGNGSLVLLTSLGEISFLPPKAFLLDSVSSFSAVAWSPSYSLYANAVSINTDTYDPSKQLVIQISQGYVSSTTNTGVDWITFYGGAGDIDITNSIAFSSEGDLITGGNTDNIEFPDAVGATISQVGANFFNAIGQISLFSSEAVLEYITFLGGSSYNDLKGLVVDNIENIILSVGETNSDDFPTTIGSGNAEKSDGFVAILDIETGGLLKSKLFGGNNFEGFNSIALNNGRIFITGYNTSGGFPTEEVENTYYQSSSGGGLIDGIILELDSELGVVWSTYFGGENDDYSFEIIVDEFSGSFYLCGFTSTGFYSETTCGAPSDGGFPNCAPQNSSHFDFGNGETPAGIYDLFIAEFNKDKQLVWTTFFGGAEDENFLWTDNYQGHLVINPKDNKEIVVIAGTTDFSTFPDNPDPNAYFQSLEEGVFIASFYTRELSWVTGFGCSYPSFSVRGESAAFDPDGNLFIVGVGSCDPQDENDFCTAPTSNDVFPICPPQNPEIFFQDDANGDPVYQGGYDAFVAGFNSHKELLYSTFLGGNSTEGIWASKYDPLYGDLFLTGFSTSDTNFPWVFPSSPENVYKQTTRYGFLDGFIARLDITEGTVGFFEKPLNKGTLMTVSPNPATNLITISFDKGAFGYGNGALNLYDFFGKNIARFSISNEVGNFSFEVNSLPSGIYVLEFQGEAVKFVKL